MRCFPAGFLLLSLAVGACDCGGPGVRGLDKTEDAGVSASSSTSSSSSGSISSSSSVTSSSTQSSSGPPPVDVASRQRLTLTLQNNAALDTYVVTAGWYCTPLGILHRREGTNSWDNVPLAVGFQCGCECPNPGPPQAIQYTRIPPGGTHVLQWDARRLVTYVEERDCSGGGFSGTARVVHGVMQPVDAGTYAARVAVIQGGMPPGACASTDGTVYNCNVQPGGLTTFPDLQSMCSTTGGGFQAVLDAMFELPAVGDVSATLSIAALGG